MASLPLHKCFKGSEGNIVIFLSIIGHKPQVSEQSSLQETNHTSLLCHQKRLVFI